MDTFPYDTWAEAFAGANENYEGYFTWGPGGNDASYVLAFLGIALFLYFMIVFTMREDADQRAASDRLRQKWS